MRKIPARLQCAYCLRNHSHGGECHGEKFDDTGCLAFLPDPKGCIRNDDAGIRFPIYNDIPPLKFWQDGWTINDVETKIRINWIRGVKWDVQKGQLILYCNYDYYINEYHEDYRKPEKKPTLKIVKE